MAKSVKEVLELAKDVQVVDLRFVDLPGTSQHFTMPVQRLTEDFFQGRHSFRRFLHSRLSGNSRIGHAAQG